MEYCHASAVTLDILVFQRNYRVRRLLIYAKFGEIRTDTMVEVYLRIVAGE